MPDLTYTTFCQYVSVTNYTTATISIVANIPSSIGVVFNVEWQSSNINIIQIA